MSVSKLPDSLHGTKGNHVSALELTKGIAEYVQKAVNHLDVAGQADVDPLLRGGYLKAGYEMLDTIQRHAKAAQNQLHIAWLDGQ